MYTSKTNPVLAELRESIDNPNRMRERRDVIVNRYDRIERYYGYHLNARESFRYGPEVEAITIHALKVMDRLIRVYALMPVPTRVQIRERIQYHLEEARRYTDAADGEDRGSGQRDGFLEIAYIHSDQAAVLAWALGGEDYQ